MKSPSTGNDRQPSDPGQPREDHPGGPSQTRTSVDGEPSPRLPHERDESSDSTAPAPDDVMKAAAADAQSDKQPSDKSEATDAAYEKMRGRSPGAERDRPAK